MCEPRDIGAAVLFFASPAAARIINRLLADGRSPERNETADGDSTVSTLDEIKDWIAICNAKARFCRTLDTKDWDGFRDLFTEDCELDLSDGTGLPVMKGREVAIGKVVSSLQAARTVHQVHVPEITVGGDEAHAVWAMQDRVVLGPDKSLTGYGHYHERWVRQNGAWKIASLKLSRLHIDMQFPAPSA